MEGLKDKEEPPLDPERARGELMLMLGVLARFFKTPLDYWENKTPQELRDWWEVMEEIARREAEALEKQKPKAGV